MYKETDEGKEAKKFLPTVDIKRLTSKFTSVQLEVGGGTRSVRTQHYTNQSNGSSKSFKDLKGQVRLYEGAAVSATGWLVNYGPGALFSLSMGRNFIISITKDRFVSS